MQASKSKKISKAKAKESKTQVSFIGSLINDLLIAPPLLTSVSYINVFIVYLVLVLLIAGYQINLWYGLAYFPLLFILNFQRQRNIEKERIEIAHSIPFFSDALANALSIGENLEQAFTQAAYYLKGKMKPEFIQLVLKNTFGKNLDVLLRELDAKYPNTGLIYLISLINSYSELGVGISPLLKRISIVLTSREKAEEKIRSILAGGSSYAWLTIGIFGVIFLALGFMLKDQLQYLLSPKLKPVFIFLIVWACTGIFLVTRLTSLDFTRTSSLKPYLVNFYKTRKLTEDEVLKYSGIVWSPWKKLLLMFIPMVIGLGFAYIISWSYGDFFIIFIGFIIGYCIGNFLLKYILNGLVEDQLIKTIEAFPEIMQIFIIGLNSGLNTYLAFQFALNTIKDNIPKILNEELCRIKFAVECGEEYERTWKRLAERLPFESIADFADIMAIAPMQGESILDSIVEMINSYQEKKLLLIEKKATKISQLIIPLIIIAFFPLFLFFVFAPMITKITLFIS